MNRMQDFDFGHELAPVSRPVEPLRRPSSDTTRQRPAMARRGSTASTRNPFETPRFASPIPSVMRPRRRFKSSRLVGKMEKPWLDGKKGVNWDSIIYYTGIFLALALSGYICWDAIRSVPVNQYCLIMDDSFQNLDNWGHEVQLNGFGVGSFDWTTDDPANSYVDEAGLHIVPTLTTQSTNITFDQLLDGYTVNLTADGSCTSRAQRQSVPNPNKPPSDACYAHSNFTKNTYIPPIRSARLTTAGKKTIKYGRVEVVAKLPAGNWLWPAIWMMPQDSVYGPWPLSGEIDICESRGNDAQSYPLGNNLVISSMHWGTTVSQDSFMLSSGEWGAKRTKYSDDFHTYGLEWSAKYLFTWLDGRLRQVVYFDFTKHKNMWSYEYGESASSASNASALSDPWSWTGRSNTPFDQDFYLILNVAVGGTNTYWPDAMGNKPWSDGDMAPGREFIMSNASWLPTWGDANSRGMTVKSVKMWQEGTC